MDDGTSFVVTPRFKESGYHQIEMSLPPETLKFSLWRISLKERSQIGHTLHSRAQCRSWVAFSKKI